MEKTLHRHARRLQTPLHLAHIPFSWILIRLNHHNAVPEVAAEEQILPQRARIRVCEGFDRDVVRGRKFGRERAVQGEIFFDESVFVGQRVGQRC